MPSSSTRSEKTTPRCWAGAPFTSSSPSSPSPHHCPAIDVDGLPRHEGRGGGAKESDEARHLLGGAAHGDAGELTLPAATPPEYVHARGVDGARAHRIDGDTVACHFQGPG